VAGNRERRTVADAMDGDYRDRTRLFSVRHTNKDLGGKVRVIVLRGCASVSRLFFRIVTKYERN
jgi:hypothetical protein